MKPLSTIQEVLKHISESFHKEEEFLIISEVLNDKSGINMAIIVDSILSKGYFPNGYEQKNGYRMYRYQKE